MILRIKAINYESDVTKFERLSVGREVVKMELTDWGFTPEKVQYIGSGTVEIRCQEDAPDDLIEYVRSMTKDNITITVVDGNSGSESGV